MAWFEFSYYDVEDQDVAHYDMEFGLILYKKKIPKFSP